MLASSSKLTAPRQKPSLPGWVLEVRFLWLQEVTRNKQLQVVKVRGKANPADVLTKSKSFREACELMSLVRVIDSSRECDWVGEGCRDL